MTETAARARSRDTTTLSVCNFLSKGWEVSILVLLATFLQDKHSLSIFMVGVFSTIFIVCQIGISYFAGKIAHAIHSRNVILLSITASGLSWLLLCIPYHPSLLYISYALGGISSGLFEPIGNSLVAKLATSSNRTTAIGNFAAFGDMGKIGVQSVATFLAGTWLGLPNTCLVFFVSTIVALVLALSFIPRKAEVSAEDEEPVHIGHLLQNTNFCYATAAGIADSFSSASLYIFMPILLIAKGVSLERVGYYNVVFFAGYMSGRLVLGRLADRHGAAMMLILCKAAMAALIVLLTLTSGPISLLLVVFILGVFTRGSSPIIRAMVANSMHEKASFHDAFGVFSFASRGSSAVSRPVFASLASVAGIGSVFYLASAVSLLIIYPAVKYKK